MSEHDMGLCAKSPHTVGTVAAYKGRPYVLVADEPSVGLVARNIIGIALGAVGGGASIRHCPNGRAVTVRPFDTLSWEEKAQAAARRSLEKLPQPATVDSK
jgi:hypothetical protein